ncbi:ATP-binding protein [Stenotrophomonas maltophilia]|nr:ATP-binding protein [Stenotrophomonas maltophilia]KMU66294.1 Heat shock protein G like protein [Stenotrophomonas maltophilia]
MDTELVLRYSHNVVEHLGLKLYQNQPTRVIAELVSNSWDADSTLTLINSRMQGGDRWVAVADNGIGMSLDVLRDAYLVIGYPKRKTPEQRSPSGRPLMGRKGIGKLAAFGIARTVDLVTASDGKVTWLQFDRDDLLAGGSGAVAYHPKIIAEELSIDNLSFTDDQTGQVKNWLSIIDGSGTLVLMTRLSIVKSIGDQSLISSLGSRFTLSTSREMCVKVNGEQVRSENSLPKFDKRIPEDGVVEYTLPISGKTIKHWVGFVKNADWPQDEAGVGVYAHGKIAQDRPFVFGVKGNEIFTRYMLGFVEADWLDELNADIISTDRTTINWDAPEVRELFDYGQKLVRKWTAEFHDWRKSNVRQENKQILDEIVKVGRASQVTEEEEREIIDLVSEITPGLGKGPEADAAKARVIGAVSDAWVQKPMRKLVVDLWSSFGKNSNAPPEAFAEIVERLSAHSIPESLNLAVVFAQRAFALSKLYDYVHNAIETDLQKLIEQFPWIVEPDTAVLTANQGLRTVIRKAEENGQIPTGRRSAVAGVPIANRPDFVFLSSPEDRHFVIVELKSPQEDLSIDNYAQLTDYMNFMRAHYPDADIRGFLIGRSPASLKSYDEKVKIVPWTDVLRKSRARNIELLSAMLIRSGGKADERTDEALDLIGPEARQQIDQLAEHHEELRALMNAFTKNE